MLIVLQIDKMITVLFFKLQKKSICLLTSKCYIFYSKLTISKLLHLLETHADGDIVKERFLCNDALFSFPFEKNGNLIQFELTADTLLTASRPLSPVCIADTKNYDLPDIYPIKATITLNPENIYDLRTLYRK